jgi:hypothetical protein
MDIEKINLKMYDNYVFVKELKFYNNHKSEVKEKNVASKTIKCNKS